MSFIQQDPAPHADATADELGAHVSSAGGVHNAPGRAAHLDAVVLQLFTKQPNRWAERQLQDDDIAAWDAARAEHRISTAAAHDSYLINLATPDPALYRRSLDSFRAELRRCTRLGLDFLVTHPGNATDGDRASGLRRNADAIATALHDVPGATTILLESTAGSGTALGSTFQELHAIIERAGPDVGDRLGVCLDTCHLYAAGYDLAHDYDAVMRRLDHDLGIERVRLFHLNDSATPFHSHRDRHAHIGQGSLGLEPFRALLNDPRFRAVPKLLETPKGDDSVGNDRRNLRRLRDLRRPGRPAAQGKKG